MGALAAKLAGFLGLLAGCSDGDVGLDIFSHVGPSEPEAASGQGGVDAVVALEAMITGKSFIK